MKTFFYYVLYSTVVLTIFINDYFLFDTIPVFYIGWLLVIVLRLLLKIPINKRELIIQFSLLFIISPPFANELLNSYNSYWHAYIFMVLSVNLIFTFPYILSKPNMLFQVSMLWMILFFMGSLLSLINSERAYFVFGPNTLYRIYAFIFTTFSIASFQLNRFNFKNVFFVLMLGMYLISNVATLSRGATIVTFATLSVLYIHNSKSPWILVKNIIVLLTVLYSGLFFIKSNESVQRLLNFDVENSARAEYLSDSYKLALESDFFGFTSENAFFPFPYYPHNIFAETILYSGWYLFLCLVVSYIFAVYKLLPPTKKALNYSPLLLIGVLIGSLFSGSLFDNFMAFTIGFVVILSKFYSSDKNDSYQIRYQ